MIWALIVLYVCLQIVVNAVLAHIRSFDCLHYFSVRNRFHWIACWKQHSPIYVVLASLMSAPVAHATYSRNSLSGLQLICFMQVLGADGLLYQSVDDLLSVAQSLNPDIQNFEASCFTGMLHRMYTAVACTFCPW